MFCTAAELFAELFCKSIHTKQKPKDTIPEYTSPNKPLSGTAHNEVSIAQKEIL